MIDSTPVQKRYKAKPFVGSSHSWAQDILSKIDTTATLLDIGPGSGVMGYFLKSRGFNSISAIEIDWPTRAQLEKEEIYKHFYDSILDVPDNSVDCVLLLDVLEHMNDPFDYLEKLTTTLKQDATILISVPNIAHWSIRFSLLFGYFEYTDRGILDKTHVQFFNRKRFYELCKSQSEFQELKLSASLEPAEFVLPESISTNSLYRHLRSWQLSIAEVLPGFFAYQHLACIRVKK